MTSAHLASVSTTLLDAGTHHVVADVQLHLVGDLVVETITKSTVDDRYDDVLDYVRDHPGCIADHTQRAMSSLKRLVVLLP